MKLKMMFLSAATAVLVFPSCGFLPVSKGVQSENVVQKVDIASLKGAWKLNMSGGKVRYKFIGDGVWTITQADPKSGHVVFHHGGTYTLRGNSYVETLKYASINTYGMIGEKNKFRLTLEGDTLHSVGIGNPWTEDWVRVKK